METLTKEVEDLRAKQNYVGRAQESLDNPDTVYPAGQVGDPEVRRDQKDRNRTALEIAQEVFNERKAPYTADAREVTFEEVVKPVMEYLARHYHPHMKVIIDSTNAELVEGQKSFNTIEFIKD